MMTEPGSAIRHLLMDATVYLNGNWGDYPSLVIDVVGDVVVVDTVSGGDEHLITMTVRKLCEPPVIIVPTDEAWAEWRAERGIGIKFSDLWKARTTP